MGELEPVLQETFMAIDSDTHIPITSGKTTVYSSTTKNNGKLSEKKETPISGRRDIFMTSSFPWAGEDRFWILFLSDLGSSAYFSQLKCHMCKICDDRNSAL